ncbi:hypothetical protein Vadar_004383 [Vaccinium darrowii]|uniref:Uncharacterized protein n=1 Tax=Vaccinium darrowii TaxID=229202 RepID=A0ACB7XFP0_9ERIC|nr:hypothetical protein Vadar_004383 [Vaccinium darrowii]
MEAHRNAASARETKLYDASVSGDVQALDALMQEDKLLLDRVSLTCFGETPAHIAAMRGHVDFTRELMSRKPNLASELDSLLRSPLHVACVAGHADVVRELLLKNINVLKDRDEDGRTPFHLAVAKGRVKVLSVLIAEINTRDELTREIIQVLEKGGGEAEGGSVLHLCVKYNRLEALKLVVEWMRRIDEHNSIINSKDGNGNTILHLAAALKQKETIEYLFQIRGVLAARNTKNENGFTALDVLEVFPRDLKSMEIRDIFMQAGVQRACCSPTNHHLESPPPITTITTISELITKTWKMFFKMDNKWLGEARGNLIMSASVIAAMAFQGVLSTPGGVWADYGVWRNNSSNKVNLQPGTSIMGSLSSDMFRSFFIFNTVSLMASLSTILLAISGFPLKNRLAVWLLMTTMCTSVASMALAYLYAMGMVFPANSWDSIDQFFNGVCYTWLSICGFVVLIHTFRFFAWLLERRPRLFRREFHNQTFGA